MSVASPPRRGFLSTGVPPVRRFARTTPGILIVITLMIVASCTVAAAVSVTGLQHRIAAHHNVLRHSEPFVFAAQNLYAALSEADATAATAFLSGGIQTPAMRERYDQSLAAAASALADVTTGAGDLGVRTRSRRSRFSCRPTPAWSRPLGSTTCATTPSVRHTSGRRLR